MARLTLPSIHTTASKCGNSCRKLPWQGAFEPYNATAEATGSDPTAGNDPNRISKSAFAEGLPNTTAVAGKSATSFMVEQVHKYPGQVSIYAAGAMTNVALAVRMDESFAKLAKELVIMGGYVDVNLYQVSLCWPRTFGNDKCSCTVTGNW
jgi:inosine-uridine nucleoside N-ribohydrolase